VFAPFRGKESHIWGFQELEDPRRGFVQSIDLGNTRVVQFPGALLVCGGQMTPEPGAPRSVRDYIIRHLTLTNTSVARRFVLPEDLSDWASDSVYPNIFDLERHLAALASAIVIFVESPGSIAELGAFCLLQGVTDKLLVFVQTCHYDSSSFIQFGPLRYLEQQNEGSVLAYPWKTSRVESHDTIVEQTVEQVRDEICEAIVKAIGTAGVNRVFDSSRDSDRMLLICALLNQMIGLKLVEIQQYMNEVGVSIPIALIKQYLYVLQHLRLVKSIKRGHPRYFFPAVTDQHLRFAVKPGKPGYDRDRLAVQIAEYYRIADRPRHSALAPVLASMTYL